MKKKFLEHLEKYKVLISIYNETGLIFHKEIVDFQEAFICGFIDAVKIYEENNWQWYEGLYLSAMLEKNKNVQEENKMTTLKLNYIGPADFGGDIYQDQNGRYYQDIESNPNNPSFYTMAGGIDGEPCSSIDNSIEVELINPPNHPTDQERFNYMLLSRLQSDCDYFLGNGGGNSSRLWADNVPEQIEEMLYLYNWFDDDKKPDWITLEEIYNYEIAMTNKGEK